MSEETENINVNPEAETEEQEKSPFEKFLFHQRRAAEEAGKAIAGWIPPEVREHTREAQKELMMSFKVLAESAAQTIEHEINRVRNATSSKSSGDAGDGTSTTGKTKVKVEVS